MAPFAMVNSQLCSREPTRSLEEYIRFLQLFFLGEVIMGV